MASPSASSFEVAVVVAVVVVVVAEPVVVVEVVADFAVVEVVVAGFPEVAVASEPSSPSVASEASSWEEEEAVEESVGEEPADAFWFVGSCRISKTQEDPLPRLTFPRRPCLPRPAAELGCVAVRVPPAAGYGAGSAGGSCPDRRSTPACTCRRLVPRFRVELATRFRPFCEVFFFFRGALQRTQLKHTQNWLRPATE